MALAGTAPALTYTPAANYHGNDSFTFTVNDGAGTSAPSYNGAAAQDGATGAAGTVSAAQQ